MQRYAPTTHDPQDDRKPWAIMIPLDLGCYYLASGVDARIAELTEIIRTLWNDVDPLDYPQEMQDTVTIRLMVSSSNG